MRWSEKLQQKLIGLNTLGETTNLNKTNENFSLEISISSYIQGHHEVAITARRLGLSSIVDNSIPYDTDINSLEFQVFAILTEESLECTDIVIKKNNRQEGYASHSDISQIDYHFEKACQFIIAVWDSLNLE